MTLDDRLQGAFDRQRVEIEGDLTASGMADDFVPTPVSLGPRFVLAAAAVVFVLAGLFIAGRGVDEATTTTVGATGGDTSVVRVDDETGSGVVIRGGGMTALRATSRGVTARVARAWLPAR